MFPLTAEKIRIILNFKIFTINLQFETNCETIWKLN